MDYRFIPVGVGCYSAISICPIVTDKEDLARFCLCTRKGKDLYRLDEREELKPPEHRLNILCFLLGPPWMNKTARAFFRGRDSQEERLHLVSLSQKNPELLDARITAWFFFRDREKEFGKAPLVGFFDFFKVREVEYNSGFDNGPLY